MSTQSSVSVVDDDDVLRESVAELLESAGYDVREFSSAEAFLGSDTRPDCLILDVHMPGLTGLELQRKLNEDNRSSAIIFVTAHGDVPSSVRAIKAGALEYLLKPFDPDALLESVARAVQVSSMSGRVADLETRGLGIIGASRSLKRVLDEVDVVAKTDATVLVHGETGTGKELIAQAIHVMSERRGPLVRLNCAAVPANLLESELMGHEKGAFTGALTRRIGRFEAAHEGTIFLDEIGELPLELQPKILRLLQERAFERVGGTQTVTSSARVVVATNRDLRAMVAERTFRADLYYRLNVFPISLPPLREREDDIPMLAQHFVEHFSRKVKKDVPRMPAEFLDRLRAHPWPGNVRELMHAMERATILATDGTLSVRALKCLDDAIAAGDVQESSPIPPPPPRAIPTATRELRVGDRLEDVDRSHILAVLEATNWVVGGPRGAAARLGIKRPTLIFRMKKLGIERAKTSEP
ncbi:MAG TPA: sigma-54 dependent transcriptional regulator [Kofleriaceae bacterium]|jgi:DNA-binding NtrC family response regulator